ncbi:hypothetical protein AWH56_021920 [Anaerobacillus isosaccharinicus]|uniref:MORN repeat protein n=1 Tax=Anaerobacillus isosaccharinicus TaxID=1532552 RepID=A0A1S2L1T2_9BACI|nr:hypothetical protein [Anaerobacillus isosaccharinicus]QOY35319.1 hypothetical protein AWH56_021920 [Anaerobacillus isosaccharinicus]
MEKKLKIMKENKIWYGLADNKIYNGEIKNRLLVYGKGKHFYETGELRYEGTFGGDKRFEFKNGMEYKKNGEIVPEGTV